MEIPGLSQHETEQFLPIAYTFHNPSNEIYSLGQHIYYFTFVTGYFLFRFSEVLLKAMMKDKYRKHKVNPVPYVLPTVVDHFSKHTSVFRERMLLPGVPSVLGEVSRKKVVFKYI